MQVLKSVFHSLIGVLIGESLSLSKHIRHFPIKFLTVLLSGLFLVACGGEDPSSSSAGLQQDVALADTGPVLALATVGVAGKASYLTVPSGYIEGQNGSLLGHGFTAGESYWLTITDPSGGVVTQQVSIDENGSFVLDMPLPQGGVYSISAAEAGTGEEVGSVIASVASLE